MKVFLFVVAALCVGAYAQADGDDDGDNFVVPPFECEGNAFVCKLKELGHNIKHHAMNIGSKLADVGSKVLTAATDQGKDLFTTGAQAILSTLLNHLNDAGIVGKREILGKMHEHFKNGVEKLVKFKEGLKAAYNKAVAKITAIMKKMASLKEVSEDSDKKIDEAVDEFKKEGQKGFFGMAAGIKAKLQGMFNKMMDALKEKYGKKDDEKDDKRAILDIFNNAKDAFKSVVGSLADTFKPHLDALTEGVKGLANKAKEHASGLVDLAKGHFNTLKGKLAGHIDTIKGHAGTLSEHAKNALNALKDAVSSIVSTTAKNMKGTVDDLAKTGVDAAGVIKDHFVPGDSN